MIKILEPDYDVMLKSAIWSLQYTYDEWKKAVDREHLFNGVSYDGEFWVLAGSEDRIKHIQDLHREVIRLKFRVDELKQVCGKEQE